MKRSREASGSFPLRLSLILAPNAAPIAALAQAPQPNAIRFDWALEGPTETCCEHCHEWVSEAGQITATTESDFAFFARSRDLEGATIVLDSPGGHVLVSLELGREFRRLGVTKQTSASVDPDRVARVVVTGGREHEALTDESSVAGQAPGEMVSTARASVPATYLRAQTEPARPPFVIATQSAGRVRTIIRMAAAGLADNLVTRLGSCPR